MGGGQSETGSTPEDPNLGHGELPAEKARRWDRLRRRVPGRLLIQIVLVGGLIYVAVPFIGELPSVLKSLRHAHPLWLAVGGVSTVGGLFAAAWALRASSGLNFPITTGAKVQIAATFTGVSTPASVGGLALNVRFLTKYGPSTSIATALVGLQTLIQFLVHIGLLALLALFGGSSVDILRDSDGKRTILVISGVILLGVSIAAGVPRTRRLITELWQRRGHEAFGYLRALVRSPKRLSASVLGAAGGTLSSVGTMWAVLLAVGGGDHPIVAAFVTMVGATLASAAPTPGGVGAVEAAIIASLTALGIPAGTAVAAMFGYRIISMWIPSVVGAVYFRQLARSGTI